MKHLLLKLPAPGWTPWVPAGTPGRLAGATRGLPLDALWHPLGPLFLSFLPWGALWGFVVSTWVALGRPGALLGPLLKSRRSCCDRLGRSLQWCGADVWDL